MKYFAHFLNTDRYEINFSKFLKQFIKNDKIEKKKLQENQRFQCDKCPKSYKHECTLKAHLRGNFFIMNFQKNSKIYEFFSLNLP